MAVFALFHGIRLLLGLITSKWRSKCLPSFGCEGKGRYCGSFR